MYQTALKFADDDECEDWMKKIRLKKKSQSNQSLNFFQKWSLSGKKRNRNSKDESDIKENQNNNDINIDNNDNEQRNENQI